MAHEPDLGITNPYALDEKQLMAAVELLKQQNEIVSEYWSDPAAQITSFAGGTTVLGTSWEVLRKLTEDDRFKSVLPEEGSTGWSDAWMLAAESKSPNCAYAWMDYSSSPEVNGAIAMNFGMAPANAAFCDTSEEAKGALATTSTPRMRSTSRRSGSGRRRSSSASTAAPTSPAPTSSSGRTPGSRQGLSRIEGVGPADPPPHPPASSATTNGIDMKRRLRIAGLLALPMTWLIGIYIFSLVMLLVTAF